MKLFFVSIIFFISLNSSSVFCDNNDDFIQATTKQQQAILGNSIMDFFKKQKRLPNSRTELAKFIKLKPKTLTNTFDDNYIADALESLDKTQQKSFLENISKYSFLRMKEQWEEPFSEVFLTETKISQDHLDRLLAGDTLEDYLDTHFKKEFEEKRKQILTNFIAHIKQRREFPEQHEFFGWFTDFLAEKYKKASELDEKTLNSLLKTLFKNDNEQEIFEDFIAYFHENSNGAYVINKKFINEEATKNLLEAMKNSDRYIISSIGEKLPFTEKRLKALMAYAKANNAQLFLVPLEYTTGQFDNIIHEHDWIHLVFDQVWPSKYWRIAALNVIRKMINPLASADKIGPRHESIIVGAPKIQAKTVSTSGNKHRSKTLIATGTVDDAIYASQTYRMQRTALIAEEMHEQGALIMEKVSDVEPGDRLIPHGEFAHRFIEFTPSHIDHLGVKVEEGFYDLDKHYSVSGNITDAQPYAIALADTHFPDMTDLPGMTAAIELIMKRFPNVRQLHLHDFIEGTPFNHHQEGNYRQRAGLHAAQRSIAEQIRQGIKLINYFTSNLPNTVIKVVESNHPEWINSYINQGKHLRDPENHDIGIDIHAYSVQNKVSPLEALLLLTQDKLFRRQYNISPITNIEKVVYAKVGDPHQTDTDIPVMTGMHGHKGAGGARGSKGTKVRGLDRGVGAHDHTFWREDGVMSIGAGFRTADYAKGGFSNWQGPALGLVYPDGAITHLISVGKKYEYVRDPDAPPSNPKTFFAEGYPKAEAVYTLNNGYIAQDSSDAFNGNGKLDENNPRYAPKSSTGKSCGPDLFR